MTGIGSRIRSSQIWQSVFRHGVPRSRQGRALAVLSNLFLHIHPVEMSRHSLRFSFTWGMGWLTFMLFVIEVVTGIALMFYYRPAAEHAHADMQALRSVVSFGLMREIHRWGAHAMVITAWLHMLRVFMTGSYKQPREFNWCIGVFLLVLTMLLSFTGYLLPWDQLAMWAVTVGTNMVAAAPLIGREGPGSGWLLTSWDPKSLLLGGDSVGPASLLRFYVLHCAALPVASAVLISLHLWRIRKDGGLSGPPLPCGPGKLSPGWHGQLVCPCTGGQAASGTPRPAPETSRRTKSPALVVAWIALAILLVSAAFGSWTGLKGLVNWYCLPEHFLPLVAVALIVGFLSYRCWSRPGWSALLGIAFLAGWAAAAFDPDFRRILLQPDNVAITLMVLVTAIFLRLGARRMALNDARLEQGLPPLEAEDNRRVMVWPDVLMAELTILLIAVAALIFWAILVRAPLEAPANPADVPNPSKAPWYFVGLQELLVYFDPWLAGFMLPSLIVIGLCALPYLDVNSRGNGYYTLRERPLAHGVFLFGFVVLWLLPIVVGTFLRGPNWSFFGPFEPWDVNRATPGASVDLSTIFWSTWLGRELPSRDSLGPGYWFIRELPGLCILVILFIEVPVVLRRTVMRAAAAEMGRSRFLVVTILLAMMSLILIKMLLRWVFHIKYIVAIPEASLNI